MQKPTCPRARFPHTTAPPARLPGVAGAIAILACWLAPPLQAQSDSPPVRAASGPQLVTEFVELYYLRDSYYACKLLRGDDCPDEPAEVSGHLEALKKLRTADADAKIAERDARLAAAEARQQERRVEAIEKKVSAAEQDKDRFRSEKADLEVEKKAQDREVEALQQDPEADTSAALRRQDKLESDIALAAEREQEADARLQALKGEREAAKIALAAAHTEEKNKAREAALKQAVAEAAAEEYTDARVKVLRRPLDVGVAADATDAAKSNALMRVDVRTAGPARLRLTGTRVDVKSVRELIRDQMDVPTAQARIILWRLQVSGEKAKKLEPVVRTIEESMSLAQGQSTVTFLALRDSLRETVAELQQEHPDKGPEVFYPEAIWEAIGNYYPEGRTETYDYQWTDAWPFNPVSATTLAEATLIIILAKEPVRHEVLKRFCEAVKNRIPELAHKSRERLEGKRISQVKAGYYPFTRVISVFGGIDGEMSCGEDVEQKSLDLRNLENDPRHLTPDQLELLRIFEFFRYFQSINQLEHYEKAQDDLERTLAEDSPWAMRQELARKQSEKGVRRDEKVERAVRETFSWRSLPPRAHRRP